LKKKYLAALQLEEKSQQQIADKFHVSRQVVNAVINNSAVKGYYGKSKRVREYLDSLVEKHGL
jgi:predicted DNA-binding protein YlxM (UPF0122 family)